MESPKTTHPNVYIQFEEYVKGRMADSTTGFGIELAKAMSAREKTTQ